MNRFCAIIFILIGFSVYLKAQNHNLVLQFIPKFHQEIVQFDEEYYSITEKDSVQFDIFRCYISNIQLLKNGKSVYKEKDSYHLLSFGENPKNEIKISIDIAFDQIEMQIGIDSLTNVSGAFGGALDPTNGMYWTWQNGYINFKLEGKSTLCNTRNHEFQYHIGGYQFPFSTLQTLKFHTSNPSISIDILLDKFMENLNLSTTNHIMSPSTNAVEIAKSFANSFILGTNEK